MNSEQPHPYSSFVHRVAKPARYLGGEFQSVVKDHAQVRSRFALCFPDVYDIGMSHLGTKILYSIVNAADDLLMERCFCPWPDMEAELRQRELPLLTLESAKALSEFDVVGFSLQYEMTFTNVLTMLELGGIPIFSKDRDEHCPLVIAGGPVATQPEPMSPFVDAFLIGDGEERLPRLLRHAQELKEQGLTRRDILAELAAEGGLYVPSLYDRKVCDRSDLLVVDKPNHPRAPAKVARAFLDDISRYRFPDDSPVAVAEAIFDRLSIEIARGCTEGCRFCQAGMIYRPVRERDPKEVVDTVLSALDKSGYKSASITSLSTADYSCVSPLIKELMGELRKRKVALGISSLRAYGLSEDLLDEINTVKASGLTFAPEAGTQRMRNVVSKNISEDDIFTTCHRVFSRGWKKVKLYFMIGLPTEDDEDVVGIAEMGKNTRDIGLSYNSGATVVVSVSTHVPKPHTPFQWCAQDSIEDIKRKQKIISELKKQWKYDFRYHDMRVSHIEGILSRGDERAAWLIHKAWSLGCRFDGWDEQLKWQAWQDAIDAWQEHFNIDKHIFLSTLPLDARLPWDHIDVGLEEGFLAKEYKKAMKARPSPPCGKPVKTQVHHTNLQEAQADKRKLVCYHCGIECDLQEMREERFDYLEKMGALSPPVPTTHATDHETAMARHNAGLSPHQFDQGAMFRYRVQYTKLKAVSLRGGLDITRILPRIVRRAGLNFHYSQGFQPRPWISMGPALSLGAKSIAEYMELGLLDDLSAEHVLARLNNHTPEGLHFLGIQKIAADDAGLGQSLSQQSLRIALTQEQIQQTFPDLSFENTQAFLNAIIEDQKKDERRLITVWRKKKKRRAHVWSGLENLQVAPIADEAKHLDCPPADFSLNYELLIEPGNATLRPHELVQALFGIDIEPTQIFVAKVVDREGCSPLHRSQDNPPTQWSLEKAERTVAIASHKRRHAMGSARKASRARLPIVA